jgi:hypothetical protein
MGEKTMVIDRVFKIASPCTVIPKPEAKGKFRVERMGTRRGERALIYSIPNYNDPKNPYKKGITASEFEKAYDQLMHTGVLTRSWFKRSLSACEADGPCNFTTVGGLFILLQKATYAERGVYRKT